MASKSPKKAKKKRSTFSKVMNTLTTVFLALLIVLLILMFIARASGNTFSLLGFSFFRVQSGSMEPTLKVGDVIMVHKTSIDNIHDGDIISYKANKGEMSGNVVTHRVIESPEQENGTYYLRTKGDDDAASPDPQITSDQVIGKYVATLPLMGKLYSFFLTPTGLITMIVVIIGLFGFEMISLLVSYKSLDNKFDDYYDALMESQQKLDEENASAKENAPQDNADLPQDKTE